MLDVILERICNNFDAIRRKINKGIFGGPPETNREEISEENLK